MCERTGRVHSNTFTKGGNYEFGFKMETLRTLLHFLVYCAFALCRLVFLFSEDIASFFTGRRECARKIRKGQNFELSAERRTVLSRHLWHPLAQYASRLNFLQCFISWQNSFVSPTYILQQNVSFFCVDKKTMDAVFIETPPSFDVHDPDVNPFLHIGQFFHGTHLIILPMKHLLRLVDELPPLNRLIHIASTGRCGGTIFIQMFQNLPNMTTFNEPLCLDVFSDALKMDLMHEKSLKMLYAVVRMLCKQEMRNNSQIYVIKSTPVSSKGTNIVEPLEKIFGDKIRQVFLHRDPQKTVDSLLKAALIGVLPLRIYYYLQRSAIIRHFFPGYPVITKIWLRGKKEFKWAWDSDECRQNLSLAGYAFLNYAIACRHYLDLYEKGIHIIGVRYEDLITHSKATMEAVLEYCGLPTDGETIKLAMQALRVDSQRGTKLSRSHVTSQSISLTQYINSETKKEGDLILKRFGLPSTDESHMLVGDIYIS